MSRAEVFRGILLTDVHSTDWQSLTFTGERHNFGLRITCLDSAAVTERICAGLDDAEFSISGMLVADIATVGPARRTPDGATELMIEALTVADD